MCHAIVSVAKKRHHSRLKRKKNQALPQPFEEKKNQDVVKQAAMAKGAFSHLEICGSPFGHVYGVLNVVKQQN